MPQSKKGVPMHEPSARQTIDPQLEEFTIFSSNGDEWRALRQPLGGGIYRTPDDPSSLEDIAGRLAHSTERAQVEQLSALPSGA